MPAGVSAWTPLANITLSSTAATVTFSSISGSFRDLILIVNAIGSATGSLAFRLNSDTSSNYFFTLIEGNGSTAVSTNNSDTYLWFNANYSNLSTSIQTTQVDFLDYSATDKHKNSIGRVNASTQEVSIGIGRWANTAAITSISCHALGTTFAAGSSLALYGVTS